MLPRTIRAPISARSRGGTPFTVARVPTGMNTGVSTGPCGVSSTPRRASPSRCVTAEREAGRHLRQGYTRIDNSTSRTDDGPSMKRLRVGVIYGGRSGEHEVSLASAAAVFAHLDRQRYEPVPIRIEKDGRWALAERAPSAMSAAEVIEHARLEAGRAPRVAREVHLMARPSDEPILSIDRAADRKGALDRDDGDGAVVPASASTSSSRSCTVPTARTARCRACSSSPTCPTSAAACWRRRSAWTRR